MMAMMRIYANSDKGYGYMGYLTHEVADVTDMRIWKGEGSEELC